ncbi:uncharacterized protein LOC133723306 [Rosa rugosa]|uniref:uncharacterized protein LOC133723306 n=1 Tax=Rosa rugosa TaxID=74645 RepID=UPI002B412EA4|nr:uncharacterized protein LOC133723306 [Rosa rugosa]
MKCFGTFRRKTMRAEPRSSTLTRRANLAAAPSIEGMMNSTANLAALINEFAAYLNKKQMHGRCEETIMARNENHTALFGKFAGFVAETDCVPCEEVSEFKLPKLKRN